MKVCSSFRPLGTMEAGEKGFILLQSSFHFLNSINWKSPHFCTQEAPSHRCCGEVLLPVYYSSQYRPW